MHNHSNKPYGVGIAIMRLYQYLVVGSDVVQFHLSDCCDDIDKVHFCDKVESPIVDQVL